MRTHRIVVLLGLSLATAILISLSVSQNSMRPIWLNLVVQGQNEIAWFIFLDFRLPRVIAASLIGGSLALAGVVMQSVLRNDLCEPGILGASSGTNLAITFAMFFGLHQSAVPFLLPASGALGGLITVLLVCAIAARNSTVSSISLVLIGVAISASVGALTLTLSLVLDRIAYAHAVAWMSGSLGRADWSIVMLLLLNTVIAFILFYGFRQTLDVSRLRDDIAIGLGLRAKSSRFGMLLLASLIGCVAISTIGNIPFVGIVAPHLGRRLVGEVHRRVLFVSPLIGALLVVMADLFGRLMFQPYEIPAGIFVFVFGGCYFLYLLCSPSNRK